MGGALSDLGPLITQGGVSVLLQYQTEACPKYRAFLTPDTTHLITAWSWIHQPTLCVQQQKHTKGFKTQDIPID